MNLNSLEREMFHKALVVYRKLAVDAIRRKFSSIEFQEDPWPSVLDSFVNWARPKLSKA